MDEIGPRREERLRELALDLLQIFDNGEDAGLAATMLVMALAAPISSEDRLHYLAALERLPRGSGAKPRVFLVSAYGEGANRHWRAVFADGHTKYSSSREFPTEAQANDYAHDFLMRLRGEINRP